MADGDLSSEELMSIGKILETRYGKVKMIPLKENPNAVVVKTDNEIAPILRESEWGLVIGRRRIKAILTSGAIGKLKRRASDAAANGEVHE
jgi:hypothetical protein